jgi:hypothetical protein
MGTPATARSSTSNALTAECAGVYIAEKLGARRLALLERLAAEVSTRVQADRRHIARRLGREADSELHRPGWRIPDGGSERDVSLRDSQRELIEEALPST